MLLSLCLLNQRRPVESAGGFFHRFIFFAVEDQDHQEGKDRFQYYEHRGCEYFSDEKGNDSYGLEESSRKSHEENLRARYEYLCSEIGRTREKLAELEKELSELNNED